MILIGKVPHERVQDNGEKQTNWRDAGYVAFLDFDGDKPKLTMVDNRTGAKVFFYAHEERGQQQPQHGGKQNYHGNQPSQQRRQATEDFYASGGDDINF